MSSPLNSIFLFAGEPSGDAHGANLISFLLKKNPHLKIYAVAGPKMRKFPIEVILPMEKFLVMGFTDVVFSLPKILTLFYTLRKKILSLKTDVALFIDYAEFSLRMERSLRKKGYQGKLVQFIAPSVWAWRKKRVQIMDKSLDLLLTIFPFEKPFFSSSPFPTHYVGNPLKEKIENYPYSDLNIEKGKKCLAIFPGSRKKEIERNLPLQLETARQLAKQDPEISIFVSLSQDKLAPLISSYLDKENKVAPEKSYDLMKSAYMAIATSGTVTLELALHKTPTVVTFAITALDQFIAQKMFKIDLPFYCIVNIIENRSIFPELFGSFLTKESLLSQAKQCLYDTQLREKIITSCEGLKGSLMKKNPNREVCDVLLNI